jgi:hypothetical protein
MERVEIIDHVVVADGDARLHRHGREPVALDPELRDMLRLGEGRVGCVLVAEHEPERDVAVRIVIPHLGRAVLGGVLERHHDRERLVIHRDQLGGVARLRERLRDHEGDTVADVAHPLGIEQGLEGAVALGGAEILRHQVRGEGAEMLIGRVGAGQHGEHAGSGLGLGDVDTLDAGVGMRRQHRHPMAEAGQAEVVDIAPLSREEALVFHPPHRLSDTEFGGHVRPPFC